MIDIILHMQPADEGGPEATPEQIIAALAPLGISLGVIKVIDVETLEPVRIVDVANNYLSERQDLS